MTRIERRGEYRFALWQSRTGRGLECPFCHFSWWDGGCIVGGKCDRCDAVVKPERTKQTPLEAGQTSMEIT